MYMLVVEIFVGKTWHKIQHHQNYIHLIWDLSVRYWTFQRRQQFMNLFANKKKTRKNKCEAKQRRTDDMRIFDVHYPFACWHSLSSFALRHRNRSCFHFFRSKNTEKHNNDDWNICTFSVARSIRQFILQWLLFGIFMRIILIWLNNKWMYNSQRTMQNNSTIIEWSSEC